ncbi:MAG: hypothetical protein R3219_07235, partial [Hydrogenovibrio sp.]|nr:hypothetical protein [Hydrogenovibrio sp.]
QGVVDLKAAFSPVGQTSIPISSTSSVPLSSASFALPAGFTPVTVSSAFVDGYRRDFTLSFQTPVLAYDSGLNQLTRDFAHGQEQPRQWQQSISSGVSAHFQTSGGGYTRVNQGLLYLGLASNYRQQLTNTTIGQAGVQVNAGDVSASFNALIPRESVQGQWRMQLPRSEGGSAELQYDGFTVNPYWLQTSGRLDFSGAEAQNLVGVLSQFEKNGWVAGFEYSEQRQPGAQLVQDYRIDSRRYFAGYQSQWQGIEFGVLGYQQQDHADIGFYHPVSVGDGSLYYVKDSLASERHLEGVSASLATKSLKLSILSNTLDTVTFLGWRKQF